MLCTVPDCGKPFLARGYCSAHWTRWKRHGDPLIRLRRPNGTHLAWIEKHLTYAHDECLPWPFARTVNGYGTMRYNGRQQLASKVVCEKTHGPPAPGQDAAHSCGNRLCCNPRHLRWLSRSENNLEKNIHGTMTKGDAIKGSRLTADKVHDIRRQLADGARLVDLARQYGVHRVTISHIGKRKIWAWLPVNAEFTRRTVDHV